MARGKIWDRIIFWSFSLLFFLTPLVLTPVNYELFEFNKMVLTYLLTAIIVWAWINKMISQKRLIFRRTFWDLPLLLFLASQITSTLISIDRHTSIFGYYSRFHGGLLSTICYLLLYWAWVSNFPFSQPAQKTRQKMFIIILVSGMLVSLYGVAEHFGIDKNIWVQDVQNRVFSTLGQPNWLAAYLDVLIFIVLARFIHSKRPITHYPLLFSLFYLCLLYTRSRSGFLGFIIPFLVVLTKWLSHLIRKKDTLLGKKLLLIVGLALTLSFWVGVPFHLKNLRTKLNLSFLSDVQEVKKPTVPMANGQAAKPKITPSSDIRKIVWKGAIELWRRHPIFGSGVETFAYSYYWVRPKEHNFTSEWDFLYNKAHNEFLNFAATSGSVGLLAYLLLAATAIVRLLRDDQFFLCCAILSLLITNFFGFSVVPTALLFYLLPALATTNKKDQKENPADFKLSFWQAITTLALVVLLGKIVNYWRADYYFAQGKKLEKAGYLNTSLNYLNRSLALNPNEPNFYSQRAITAAKLAAAMAQKGQPSDRLIKLAIKDSKKALEISPYHLNFYKNRAKTDYFLSFVRLDYLRDALQTLLEAEKLAPTDPKIPYNIGLIYRAFGDRVRARQYLQKALELKPDYTAAKKAIGTKRGKN